jgi:hypothetical protein
LDRNGLYYVFKNLKAEEYTSNKLEPYCRDDFLFFENEDIYISMRSKLVFKGDERKNYLSNKFLFKNDSSGSVKNLSITFQGDNRTKFMYQPKIKDRSLDPAQSFEVETMSCPKEYPFFPVIMQIDYTDRSKKQVSAKKLLPINSVSFMSFIETDYAEIQREFSKFGSKVLESGRQTYRRGIFDKKSLQNLMPN